ncbi:flavoprotein NADH-dependent oxidoreductase [Flagelloscypha sp. PMI_526]|nr:flavoprotein NADH-dependent oxidoreductase [Flagelloscypha sp. PMI_526]
MSETNFSSLFEPLQVGSITLSNRLIVSATTRSRSNNTVPTPLMAEYYAQRAKGEAGLIITEGILVSSQGTEWPGAPGLWNDDHVKGWKDIVDKVHEEGGKIYAQLWHVGRCANSDAPAHGGQPVWAPSAIQARGGKLRFLEGEPGYSVPTEIQDPTTIIAEYANAAVNAKAAGFDGVELHYANGYLPHQFLDSTSNVRTDAWGGSTANRARFGLEVVKKLKEVFGENVGVKLSPCGGNNDMGMPLEETIETFSYVIKELVHIGVSYVTLLRYSPWGDPELDGKKRGVPHDMIQTYRHLVPSDQGTTKFFLNSGLTPVEAAEFVSSKHVDAVTFGMSWITHPDLAKRVRAGKELENAPQWHLLYGTPGMDPTKGYTDYPLAVYE